MRTKTLLLAAALSAAGLATSMAQTVYSVNSVGYVNTVIAPQYSIISNPLDGGSTNLNSVTNLFAGSPNNFIVYKFVNGGYLISRNIATQSRWSDPNLTLAPGEGAFVFNPSTAFTNTFIGTVVQGTNISVSLPSGFSMASSLVPQGGTLGGDLGFTPAGLTGNQSVTIYQFVPSSQTYASTQYRFGAWPTASPSGPTIGVGEAFFANSAVAQTWTRTFTTQTP